MIYIKILDGCFYAMNTDLNLKTGKLFLKNSYTEISANYTKTFEKELDFYLLEDILKTEDLHFMPAGLAFYMKLYYLKKYFKNEEIPEKIVFRTLKYQNTTSTTNPTTLIKISEPTERLPTNYEYVAYNIDLKNKTWELEEKVVSARKVF